MSAVNIDSMTRLTDREFDSLVERWNRLTSIKRKDRAGECAIEGHKYAIAPFSDEKHPTKVCRRCCKYVNE